ncbi:uncharacterized protein LTHEOB_2932 [Lasiodiplodia theobromae]|uniref:uncharacterized protein n=1 Tax=Lasiodiplodia theobromae TaxID=45133 RepID=UPI0015C39DED|nr:uncharacterized protein LTHEOB_2932 [Lasiodiplodia theobromae]KAF4534957.1 hypothetical protein LTHEOB_2932 [Lasiodiplodia theobromae]
MPTHPRIQPLVPATRGLTVLPSHPKASALPAAQSKHNNLESALLKLPDELLLMILKLNHAITGTFVDTKSMRQVCTRLDPIGAEVLCRHKPHDGRFKIYVGRSDLHGLKGLKCIAAIARGTRMGMLIPGVTFVYKSAPRDAIYANYSTRPSTAETLPHMTSLLKERIEHYYLHLLLIYVFNFIKSIQSITYSQDADLTMANAEASLQEDWDKWDMHSIATPAFAFWPIRVLLGAIKDANVELKQITLLEVQMLYPTRFHTSTQRELEFPQPWIHQLRNLTSLSLRLATVVEALITSLDNDPAYPGPTHLIAMLKGLPALKTLKLSSTESEPSAWQLGPILRETFPFRLESLRLRRCVVFNMDDLAGFIARHRAEGPFSLTLRNIVVHFVGPTDDGVERLDVWKGFLRFLAKHATADTRLSLRGLFSYWHPLPPFTDVNIAVDKVTSRYLNQLSALPNDRTVRELLHAAIKDLKVSTWNHLLTTEDL